MKKFKDEIYIVKKGDTLSSIATEFNVNPTQILIDNKCLPKMLQEGYVLYIKTKSL